MTTAAPARPAARRGAAPRPKPIEIPFRLIFEAFPADRHSAVQVAIDALILAKRSPSVLRVKEYMAGILPAAVRPPSVLPVVHAKTLPPVVQTIRVAGPPEDDLQAQHLARCSAIAPGQADRLAERLARCFGHAGLTEAEEARYQRMTRDWQDFGYLPSANAYAGGCGE